MHPHMMPPSLSTRVACPTISSPSCTVQPPGIMSLFPINVLERNTRDFQRGLLVVEAGGVCVCASPSCWWTWTPGCVCGPPCRILPFILPGVVYAVVHLHAHSAALRREETAMVVSIVRGCGAPRGMHFAATDIFYC
jgi:hypothetical protein